MSDIPPPPPPPPPYPGPPPAPPSPASASAAPGPGPGPGTPGAPGAPNRSVYLLALVGLVVVVGGFFVLTSGGDDDEPGADDFMPPATAPSDAAGPDLELEPDGEPGDDGSGADGSAGSGGATPTEAVQGYIEAVVDADCEAMVAHMTENMLAGMDRAMAVEDCESTAENQPEMADLLVSLDLTPADEEGGVARIEGHGDVDGTPLLIVFTLVEEGGAWLIDDVA